MKYLYEFTIWKSEDFCLYLKKIFSRLLLLCDGPEILNKSRIILYDGPSKMRTPQESNFRFLMQLHTPGLQNLVQMYSCSLLYSQFFSLTSRATLKVGNSRPTAMCIFGRNTLLKFQIIVFLNISSANWMVIVIFTTFLTRDSGNT